MPDTGCGSNGVIDCRYARKHGLKRIRIPRETIVGFTGDVGSKTDYVVAVEMDINGHRETNFFYEVDLGDSPYGIILGLPWFTRNDVVMHPSERKLTIGPGEVEVFSKGDREPTAPRPVQVSAAGFFCQVRRQKIVGKLGVFSASLRDIDKALSAKAPVDPQSVLPKCYHRNLALFEPGNADQLPPLRGKGIDHSIELERDADGKEKEVPWGPLYSMSKDELLVLRKTLTELLDKQFIRVSSSPAAAPVLFVRKPGGGLRFCIDYRALNRISKKDRYPLPLIHETLRTIAQAKWFTKLDVSAAFYKLRIAKGDEWKTAFRTRYGSFEWLVTPFGLAGAPSTFQRYINTTLRDYLDDFCSAYLDDVLIYTNGSLKEHRKQVQKVLARLQDAGLYLDISKCEFEVKTTKYLGFIIEAGKGTRMDPEKVKAVLEWAAPKTVKGVQAFIGFANFYRKFIDGFSNIVRPIMALTHKDHTF